LLGPPCARSFVSVGVKNADLNTFEGRDLQNLPHGITREKKRKTCEENNNTTTPSAFSEPIYSRLRGDALDSGGIMISCRDPKTMDNYVLFGVTPKNTICHFHGKNELKTKEISYIEATYETAAREFQEESLAAVGTKSLMDVVLRNHPECYFQIFPVLRCQITCFLVTLGEIGQQSRLDIARRFQKLRANPLLGPREKEVTELVWVKSKDLWITCNNSSSVLSDGTTLRLVPCECEGSGGQAEFVQFQIRNWLSEWLYDLLGSKAKGRQEPFYRFCRENEPINLKPYTLI